MSLCILNILLLLLLFFVTGSVIGLLPHFISHPRIRLACGPLSPCDPPYLINLIQHTWQFLSDILDLYKYLLLLQFSSSPSTFLIAHSVVMVTASPLNPHTTFFFLHEDFFPSLDEYGPMSPCLVSFWLLFSRDFTSNFILPSILFNT